MNAWWQRLSLRERWLVGGGGAVAVVLLLYALVWSPFQRDLHNLRQAVAAQRSEIAWMRAAAEELKRLHGAQPLGTFGPRTSGRSLLTLVDQTAKQSGLGAALTRVEPQGSDKLRIRLENVAFDQMIRWLGVLAQEYGVAIDSAVVDREDTSGLVNARLVLQGSTA